MNQFGIIGFGKMGHALLKGMTSVIDCPVMLCDTDPNAFKDADKLGLKSYSTTSSVEDVASHCDVILLAVKPIHAQHVIEKILNSNKPITVLSIVAGLKLDRIARDNINAVRIMPNTPALVGAASCVVVDQGLTPQTRELVSTLLGTCGDVHFVANENLLDAVTGLSGSGPALFAVIAEALADAAVAEGLPRSLANALARETMLGTAKLMQVEHPDILKENVMSPGGTTAAGLIAAEKAGIRPACQAFVCAATNKSRNL